MSPSKATVYRVAYRFHVLIARQRLEQGVPVGQVVDDFMQSLLELLAFCDDGSAAITMAPEGSGNKGTARRREWVRSGRPQSDGPSHAIVMGFDEGSRLSLSRSDFDVGYRKSA